MFIAAYVFGLEGCIGARIGRGIDSVSQFKNCSSVLWYWGNGSIDRALYRRIEPGTQISLQRELGHGNYKLAWSVQFVLQDRNLATQAQSSLSSVPLLGEFSSSSKGSGGGRAGPDKRTRPDYLYKRLRNENNTAA